MDIRRYTKKYPDTDPGCSTSSIIQPASAGSHQTGSLIVMKQVLSKMRQTILQKEAERSKSNKHRKECHSIHGCYWIFLGFDMIRLLVGHSALCVTSGESLLHRLEELGSVSHLWLGKNREKMQEHAKSK